jgi:hypothetical protein
LDEGSFNGNYLASLNGVCCQQHSVELALSQFHTRVEILTHVFDEDGVKPIHVCVGLKRLIEGDVPTLADHLEGCFYLLPYFLKFVSFG